MPLLGRATTPPVMSWVTVRVMVLCALALLPWLDCAAAMRADRIAALRRQTVDMFYHGFDNYMQIAFPEDELRPVSCTPLSRDQHNQGHFELNDVLGNYSLTLIDSLSTLAILASAPPDTLDTGPRALRDFQDGVATLIQHYGDGRPGPSGQGTRARGFDLDSKVQVFETVIRGVGGLLSAHLFAVGELPISGYTPPLADPDDQQAIVWPNGFKYDGQLLRLALDLSQRLLPAFYTQTGMPYPRVNLRHGIPFYRNSPLHETNSFDPDANENNKEVTETCSAGAGSLVLEFTVLSRLTGDPRFEQAAKRAFWSVWSRRSNIGLIGAGVDAEEGHWIGGFSGIGAGIDSFFEYALKTHILLSGHELPNRTRPDQDALGTVLDPNDIYRPLSDADNSPDSFLQAWHHAHAAIKRHLYSDDHHPHYINAHVSTGSPQAYWIDSLGAYYSGLLALAGELDESIKTHLLYTALWTRYSALPERWSVRDGNVEGGLGWWPGRPEFIESTYHIYRATRDPWYLYVGEMVLRDITRRCKTDCGWSGLQDVRTGELSDRMESFFLGETAKYLYLLFDQDHPLNKLDAAYVFTTEGHPLILPRKRGHSRPRSSKQPGRDGKDIDEAYYDPSFTNSCPLPPPLPPLSGSATAARPDFYSASALIRLHNIPNTNANPDKPANLDVSQASSLKLDAHKANHTVFPWTLPHTALPDDGVCVAPKEAQTLVIEFPTQKQVGSALSLVFGGNNLVRLGNEGIIINNLSGLKVAITLEEPPEASERRWRISSLGNLPLGRDEKVMVTRDVLSDIADPLFHRIRDPVIVDIMLQLSAEEDESGTNSTAAAVDPVLPPQEHPATSPLAQAPANTPNLLSSLLQQITSKLREPAATLSPDPTPPTTYEYLELLAITPVGPGAAPLPDVREAPHMKATPKVESLSWSTVYFAGQACEGRLPADAPRNHQVIVMRRGGCSFSQKLQNIPSFAPSRDALQLVIIVSDDEQRPAEEGSDRDVKDDFLDDHDVEEEEEEEEYDDDYYHYYDDSHDDAWDFSFVRPMLEDLQMTPSGIPRHHPISMVMVSGGDDAYDLLKQTRSLGVRRRYHVESQGLVIDNLVVL